MIFFRFVRFDIFFWMYVGQTADHAWRLAGFDHTDIRPSSLFASVVVCIANFILWQIQKRVASPS